LNEAFASQAIACVRELKFDMEKTNVNGAESLSVIHRMLGRKIDCHAAS